MAGRAGRDGHGSDAAAVGAGRERDRPRVGEYRARAAPDGAKALAAQPGAGSLGSSVLFRGGPWCSDGLTRRDGASRGRGPTRARLHSGARARDVVAVSGFRQGRVAPKAEASLLRQLGSENCVLCCHGQSNGDSSCSRLEIRILCYWLRFARHDRVVKIYYCGASQFIDGLICTKSTATLAVFEALLVSIVV